MDCSSYIASLPAVVAGDVEAAARVRGHEGTCAACARRRATLEEAIRGIEALPPVPAPADLARRVWERIERIRAPWEARRSPQAKTAGGEEGLFERILGSLKTGAMKRTLAGLALGTAVLLFVVARPADHRPGGPAIALVTESTPGVTVERGPEAVSVHVPAGGRAIVTHVDTVPGVPTSQDRKPITVAMVVVEGPAHAGFERARHIRLGRGTLRLDVWPEALAVAGDWRQGQPNYRVTTPHAVATVLGTRFSVRVAQDTVVELRSGSVEVRAGNLRRVLSPGEGVRASAGQLMALGLVPAIAAGHGPAVGASVRPVGPQASITAGTVPGSAEGGRPGAGEGAGHDGGPAAIAGAGGPTGATPTPTPTPSVAGHPVTVVGEQIVIPSGIKDVEGAFGPGPTPAPGRE